MLYQNNSCSGNAISSLPWEGIVKLILTGMGIIGSVLAISLARNEDDPKQQGKISESEYVSNIRYATIYLFFALSGLMDIVVYYCGYAVLPGGIQVCILQQYCEKCQICHTKLDKNLYKHSQKLPSCHLKQLTLPCH